MGFCVAVDGPAAAGKGTISKALAERLGFEYLDTGLLYRAVGARVLEGADPIEAAKAVQVEDLNNPQLRRDEVAKAASRAAAMPEVRDALMEYQRAFGARAGGAVLDGRDIGSVICPDAPVKLFITANPQVRAKRRLQELLNRGIEANFERVHEDVLARDERDSVRATAPLRAAESATVIDTTDMSIEEAFARAWEIVQKAQRNIAEL